MVKIKQFYYLQSLFHFCVVSTVPVFMSRFIARYESQFNITSAILDIITHKQIVLFSFYSDKNHMYSIHVKRGTRT